MLCRCVAAKEQRDHMRAMGHPIPDSDDSDAEDASVRTILHVFHSVGTGCLFLPECFFLADKSHQGDTACLMRN